MGKKLRLSAILFLFVLYTNLLPAQIISTFAGGFGAGPAACAELNAPLAVTTDHAGNIYIADGGNNIIRKIDHATGVATIIAGNGCNEYYGDNGAATEAAIYLPSGLAIDRSGNIYIADNENNTIRKVNTSGIITTIAGNGSTGFSGDNGPAINALLNVPASVAVDDSGNVYIADENNNRIRKINIAGIITTIAGNGSPGYSGNGGPAINAQLHNPVGVSVDVSGNVYVADMYNNVIRKINVSGIISTIAGNGTMGYSGNGGIATAAQLSFPTSVFVDSMENIYIGDNQNNVIRKVDNSGTITTIAGNTTIGFYGDGGPATSASLSLPYGVTVDGAGNIYIADQANNRVRIINSSGIIRTFAGPGYYSGDGGTSAAATLYRPRGITTDGNGNFFIADTYNRRIRKIDAARTISTFAGTGNTGDNGNGGPAATASFYLPFAVAADHTGNVFILDTNNTIRKVNSSGIITAYAGNGIAGYNGDGITAVSAKLNKPNGIAIDHVGNLYISDYGNNRIRKIDTAGIISTYAGIGSAGFSGNGGLAIAGQINAPTGVAVDNNGNVYIADYFNYMIRKVDTFGIISTIAGTGIGGNSGYGGPALSASLIVTGVSVDNNGNVYILNNSDDIVLEINASGIINKIAGLSSEDYGICGENGIDSAADLSNPMAVVADDSGNIYIADEFNNRIRIIYTSIRAEVPLHTDISDNITLFPNPANTFFTLKLSTTCTNCIITICNTLGQVVESENIPTGADTFTCNLHHIPSGNYFASVITGKNIYRNKITVIK